MKNDEVYEWMDKTVDCVAVSDNCNDFAVKFTNGDHYRVYVEATGALCVDEVNEYE